MVSQDAETKAELIKKIHQKVKENIEKRNEQTKKYVDKGRKELTFEPGDWVWLHMRTERFPNQRKSKLAPRGDGPFKVIKKINDNAYQIELPGEFNISSTFNVTDLSPFDVGDTILRSESSQGGGNDEDMNLTLETNIQVPILRRSPRTRSGSKDLREGFNQAIEALMINLVQEQGPALDHDQVTALGSQDMDAAHTNLNMELAQAQHQHSALTQQEVTTAQRCKVKVQEEPMKKLPLLPCNKGLTIFTISLHQP